MAMVPGNEKTVKQQFNSSTDRCITFTGIVKAIAKELGKEPKIVLYNPAEMGLGKGEGFPFRTNHFFAGTDKAKMVLGWAPEHNFLSSGQTLGVKAQRFRGHTSPHRNVKKKQQKPHFCQLLPYLKPQSSCKLQDKRFRQDKQTSELEGKQTDEL
eukprot:TRINITY_DN13804_c0_g1_i3.p1 TRINITY_DN13804_c0_g1~~TRINITY_DN13804_c0_g1_i3.p1  ORF type:complete len:155 (-),score=34.35 TRINITY_DN13804_c0_g1_i3:384-848(-)